MAGSVAFPEYRAIDPERGKGSLLGNAYWFLKSKVLYGPVTYPYGVLKHEHLLATCDRTQSHTYTCFTRTPSQLEALVGPVFDFLGVRSLGRPLEILNLACSNGAEAYTFASFLTKRLPNLDFRITAADLHQEMVEKASAGSYSEDEALQSQFVTPEFIAHTFDKVDGRYVVKDALKARVQFKQANLLDDKLPEKFQPADIVTSQNVLFHLKPVDARKAFNNIVRLVRPKGVLLIDGMDQPVRVQMTEAHGLEPLEYKLKEIYDESRVHTPLDWWRYYWGSEPYSPFRRDRARRYGTVFLKRPS
ncbi:MAG TPA: CheR family methyltransferase [Polyangiaceae bacterium]|nr:CheR family methyltransferase [Polyangiaceae bacterium]